MVCSTYQPGASLVNSSPFSLSAVCELGHSSATVISLPCNFSGGPYGHAGVITLWPVAKNPCLCLASLGPSFLIISHDISHPPLKFLLHLFKKKRFILGVCIWVCTCECRCLWRPKDVRTSGAGVGYRQLLMWVLDQNLALMEEQCELL